MHGLSAYRRRFGITLACATLALVALVAAFNYVIDPYAVFGSPSVVGLNAVKPRPDVMIADIKFIVGTRLHPNALILGNSRADVGFDPENPTFERHGMRAYNAAVPGSGLGYSLDAFRRFAGTTDIRFAIVGLDFLDFLHSPEAGTRSAPKPDDSGWSVARTRLLALFSTTALADSIRTLLIQREANPAVLRLDGFNPMLDYREIATTEGYAALFRQRAQETARSLAKQPHNLDAGGRRMSPSYSELRSLLQIAKDKGTDLQLVIYPYHLLLLLQYEAAGLWPLFEQWKEDVAAIVDEARRQGAQVALWDFSCPSALTAEAVPSDGDRKSTMRWYWEAGHFKKELGDLVLERVLERKGAVELEAFGVQLTSDNVHDGSRVCRDALNRMRVSLPRLPTIGLSAPLPGQ